MSKRGEMERGRSGWGRWLAAAAIPLALLLLWGLSDAVLSASPAAASWIWIDDNLEAVGSRAFFAVRDFELAAVPDEARLRVLADEEYILYLNGLRVGSNVYRAGAAMDSYRVADCLVPGRNRLVAELRSSRGAGGFLLELDLGTAGEVVSDASWSLFRRYHPGLIGGWKLAREGERPRLWGRPPTGRWGAVTEGEERPLFKDLGAAIRPQLPTDAQPITGGVPSLAGPWVLWDWGKQVTGYLSVEFLGAAPSAALLYTGVEPPLPGSRPADAAMVTIAGSPAWTAAVPRSFRYAVIVAPAGIAAVDVARVPPAEAASLLPPDSRPDGVFGIVPPPRIPPVEQEVRNRLEQQDRPPEE